MFYSQYLLSLTAGALGIVWMAAHCHKRLRKCDIQRTDISSSVDKILRDDEVRGAAQRILAFLLLGLVRIHSKKAEYLFNDCHEMLNRLSSIQTRKNKDAEIGVPQTHYHSISLPKSFELDAFDLELLEDEAGGSVRLHGKDKLAGRRRKDASTSGLLHKENTQTSDAYSSTYTPPKDVFGYSHMGGQKFLMSPTNDRKVSLAGVEVLRGSFFPVEDMGMIIQGASDGTEFDPFVGPSSNGSHPMRTLDIVSGAWLGLEDRLEPMVLDDDEEMELNLRSSNDKDRVQDMELDSIYPQFSLKQLPNEAEKGQGEKHPEEEHIEEEHIEEEHIELPNEAEKGQGHEKHLDEEHIEEEHMEEDHIEEEHIAEDQIEEEHIEEEHIEEEHIEEEHMEHPCTEFNLQEGENQAEDENQDFTASVDKTKPVDAGDTVPEVINLETVKCHRAKLRVSIVTPESKLPAAGVFVSEAASVQTPGRKECGKTLKRKTVIDLTTVIVPSEEFYSWICDTSDIRRERTKVPSTLLGSWRANKRAHFPLNFSKPSIPGISVELECNRSHVAALKVVEELPSEDECENSTDTYGAQEEAPVVWSPIREMSPKRASDVHSLVIEESSKQAPIAPATPSAANLAQFRSHEFGAVADSDILEPAASYESVAKGPSSGEPLGFDVLYDEETSSFEGGESSKKGDTFSKRTRMTANYLSMKFKEEEAVSLSHLLKGKTKKESARFFYETLVLKTNDCIDVQQEAAYHDLVLREKPKLSELLDS